jgi:hypothetical protein
VDVGPPKGTAKRLVADLSETHAVGARLARGNPDASARECRARSAGRQPPGPAAPPAGGGRPPHPSNAPSLAAQLQRGKKERPRSGSSVAVAATALSAIARVALGPEPVVVPVQPSSDLPPTSRTASTLTAPVLPLQVLPEPRTPPVNPLVKPSSSLLMADVASEGAQQSAPRAPTAPHRP